MREEKADRERGKGVETEWSWINGRNWIDLVDLELETTRSYSSSRPL